MKKLTLILSMFLILMTACNQTQEEFEAEFETVMIDGCEYVFKTAPYKSLALKGNGNCGCGVKK